MSLASLSHQPLQEHSNKSSPYVSNNDQKYIISPTAVTNIYAQQQQQQDREQQQQQQQEEGQYPQQTVDHQIQRHNQVQQELASPLELVHEPLKLSPPNTPTPTPSTKSKTGNSLRDPLITDKYSHSKTSSTTTTTATENAVEPHPYEVQTLHERTLHQFHQPGDVDITFKRHSTHDSNTQPKRRDTTMGILPLHPTDYDPFAAPAVAASSAASADDFGATSIMVLPKAPKPLPTPLPLLLVMDLLPLLLVIIPLDTSYKNTGTRSR
ncbi:unnamed protein product [Absidia cylindrospora]